MEPTFLTLEEALDIHRDQVTRYGGSSDLRDIGLLQSAVAQPSATFGGQFLHADIYEMAAAYLFHLVQNHPFVDGNKRTGTAAALVFLDINGFEFDAPDDELLALVLSVARGESEKGVVADFFRRYARIGNS